jgi:hypothetical protein
MEEELRVEAKNKIFWEEPVSFQLGPIMQTVPAFMLYQAALQLKEGLLDRYEPTQGIPTPETPEPLPYFKLIEEVEDELPG